MSKINQREIDVIADQLKFIDKRLAEIEATLPRIPAGSYRMSELLDERAVLDATRRAADRKIRELKGTDSDRDRERREADAARTEALRHARAKSYRAACIAAATSFEACGDYRNARIQRLEALNARRVAEHEVH